MNKNKGENVHREPSDSSNRKSRILCGIYSYSRLLRTSFAHPTNQATITFLTGIADLPSDYGRIVRDQQGNVHEIVEVKRATPEQKLIREVNSGVYCFERAWLWEVLATLPRNPVGEYYLTDLI